MDLYGNIKSDYLFDILEANMRSFFKGIIFSLILLILFTMLSKAVGFWIGFIFSLIISSFIFVFYSNKKKLLRKQSIFISFSTGIFFIIFAFIGITLFPPQQIRDLGDLFMPYINALILGVSSIVVFIFSEVTYNKNNLNT